MSVDLPMIDSEPRTDLEGLVEYFDSASKERLRITEVTYVINYWDFGGFIPLKHHGFVLKTEGRDWLTLDFGRRGIMWDTFDEFPDLPDKMSFVKKYKVDVDPLTLKSYCQQTKPFSFLRNDCAAWARGMMQVLNIKEEPNGVAATAAAATRSVQLAPAATATAHQEPSTSGPNGPAPNAGLNPALSRLPAPGRVGPGPVSSSALGPQLQAQPRGPQLQAQSIYSGSTAASPVSQAQSYMLGSQATWQSQAYCVPGQQGLGVSQPRQALQPGGRDPLGASGRADLLSASTRQQESLALQLAPGTTQGRGPGLSQPVAQASVSAQPRRTGPPPGARAVDTTPLSLPPVQAVPMAMQVVPSTGSYVPAPVLTGSYVPPPVLTSTGSYVPAPGTQSYVPAPTQAGASFVPAAPRFYSYTPQAVAQGQQVMLQGGSFFAGLQRPQASPLLGTARSLDLGAGAPATSPLLATTGSYVSAPPLTRYVVKDGQVEQLHEPAQTVAVSPAAAAAMAAVQPASGNGQPASQYLLPRAPTAAEPAPGRAYAAQPGGYPVGPVTQQRRGGSMQAGQNEPPRASLGGLRPYGLAGGRPQ